MVQEVFCKAKNIEIELLDLDDQKLKILKKRNKDIKRFKGLNHMKIYFKEESYQKMEEKFYEILQSYTFLEGNKTFL